MTTDAGLFDIKEALETGKELYEAAVPQGTPWGNLDPAIRALYMMFVEHRLSTECNRGHTATLTERTDILELRMDRKDEP